MARSNYYLPKPPPLNTLPAAALRAVFQEGYSRQHLRSDILAGIVVGIVALPLAMALAIGVGVPPQYGLYTSIFAGSVVPLLGGSRFQVTGPTAAFIVILAPIYLKFGLGGLLFSGLLAGLILLFIGLMRFGRFIKFIPHPVTVGFTAGIGTVIAVLQLKDFFGLSLEHNPEHFVERVFEMIKAVGTFNLSEFSVGLATLLLLIFVPRMTKKIPAPLIALFSVSLAAALIHYFFPQFNVSTIGSRFHTVIFGKEFSGIPRILPQFSAPWSMASVGGKSIDLTMDSIRVLFPSAFAIAMLGAIESLLSAMVADGMAGTRHDPDAELMALGIGNIVCPFFGGIPATGAIARTATNIRYGGRSPIASVIHGLVILVAVLAAAPLLSYLPMAGLAALLMIVAWNMSDVKHFLHIVKVAPKSDTTVLLVCYFLTVIFDMVTAVSVGVGLAALLFMERMASASSSKLISEEHPVLHVKLPQGVILYEVAGPLFFGAAEKAMETLRTVGKQTRAIIFYMKAVPIMDETGLVAFESALNRLNQQGVLTVITELQNQPSYVLKKAKIAAREDKLVFCQSIENAVETTKQFMAGQHVS